MKKSEEKNKGLKYKWLIGVDEVGRGPLAGPVAVCVCALPYTGKNIYKDFLKKYSKEIAKQSVPKIIGRDSKKLTERQRLEWKKLLVGTQARFFYGSKSARDIDNYGISVCIHRLIASLLSKATSDLNIKPADILVLLDGGLKAPAIYKNQKTIIKGDEKEMVISFASIYAKVTRDVHMVRLSKKYPAYGFDIHKGYGTLVHREAISKKGLSAEHRKSFCKNIL